MLQKHLGGERRNFKWEADRRSSVLTVAFKGELDLAAVTETDGSFTAVLEGEERLIVLDLAALSFVDSTGLRLLIKVKQTVEGRGGRLLLGRLSKPALRLLEVAHLTSWFEYLEGEVPRQTYCPICEGELLAMSDHCAECGSVF